MRTPIIIACAALLIAPSTARQFVGQGPNEQQQCSLLGDALRDYEQIKAARTRRDVMKYFAPEGGMQFPGKTRYVHPMCGYLHVDVEFELVKPSEVSPLPEDKVTEISKLYVDYSIKD